MENIIIQIPRWLFAAAFFVFAGVLFNQIFIRQQPLNCESNWLPTSCDAGSDPRGEEIPSGAVVAFDGGEYEKGPNGKLNSGCPIGWVRFEQAAGRFILGSDSYPGFDNDTPNYKLRYEDGAATHTLTKAELPEHLHEGATGHAFTEQMIVTHGVGENVAANHVVGWGGENGNSPGASDDFPGAAHTHKFTTNSSVGLEGDSHNNMPPYIALYFCKKE